MKKVILVFILMSVKGFASDCERQLSYLKWNAVFAQLIGKPTTEEFIGPSKIDGPIKAVVRGIPSFAKMGTLNNPKIFRHYTSRENVIEIVKTQTLKAGPMPYVISNGGVRKSFVNLTGVFLTTTESSPEDIGVSKDTSFIDVEIPKGTSVIELEPRIFLVPGPPLLPSWLKAYLDVPEGNVPSYARETVRRLKASGIFGAAPFTLKVKIK